MLAPVLIAPFKGRYWCGNYCPRGSFYDNVIAKISSQKPIPAVFRSKVFRVSVLIIIMSMFSIQMYFAWGNLPAMGLIFLRIIFVTTIIGIILGIFYHQRTWCSFCPMGTIASFLSGKAKKLNVKSSCISCKLCTKTCPLQLEPYHDKGLSFKNSDCLKCNRCVEVCPKKALSFEQ